jgi:subtilisin family serine protease
MRRVRPMRLVSGFITVLGMLSMLAIAPLPAETRPANKVEAELLNNLATEGTADLIAVFSEQADLSAAYGMDWDERGEYVYGTLKAVAERSQARARAELERKGVQFRTFLAGNELFVYQGDLQVVTALAGLYNVARVRASRTYDLDPIVGEEPSFASASNGLAWGIVDAKGDQFWEHFGVQGDGIVVASIDTGVQWDHPALDQAYRCPADPGNPACWEDPTDICGGTPCDNHGHGTHTVGTMVADDDSSLAWRAGMAPNAQWIACKGCEDNRCSDAALNACADWVLAPDGDPAKRPHIVNNSWGSDGCDVWYRPKVEAWQAAGIFPAFSAGNDSTCGTLTAPGIYQESFSSTGHSPARTHYGSKGPASGGACDPYTPYTKPNISAPAVAVWSSRPGSLWITSTGTSMASPHSAGAVALLWSCSPGLVGQVDATFQALQSTADAPPSGSCGEPQVEAGNYTSGYGFLNAYQAGLAYCSPGSLEGSVSEHGSGVPIAGATVKAVSHSEPQDTMQVTTGASGTYSMTLKAGTYDVSASKTLYHTKQETGVVVLPVSSIWQDLVLTNLSEWCLENTCLHLPLIARAD